VNCKAPEFSVKIPNLNFKVQSKVAEVELIGLWHSCICSCELQSKLAKSKFHVSAGLCSPTTTKPTFSTRPGLCSPTAITITTSVFLQALDFAVLLLLLLLLFSYKPYYSCSPTPTTLTNFSAQQLPMGYAFQPRTFQSNRRRLNNISNTPNILNLRLQRPLFSQRLCRLV
jgi:hypothetical protein